VRPHMRQASEVASYSAANATRGFVPVKVGSPPSRDPPGLRQRPEVRHEALFPPHRPSDVSVDTASRPNNGWAMRAEFSRVGLMLGANDTERFLCFGHSSSTDYVVTRIALARSNKILRGVIRSLWPLSDSWQNASSCCT
jgi:hypothetical protein